MSEEGSNLQTLLLNLRAKTGAIEREIQAARLEIGRATEGIAAMHREQKRVGKEIGSVKNQLQQTVASNQKLRLELLEKLASLEIEFTILSKFVIEQQTKLRILVDLQHEELARQRLEQERGKVLLGVRALLDTVEHGPVRYLFAKRALEMLSDHGIKQDAFRTLTDQATAQKVLAEFAAARDAVGVDDRREAGRFADIELVCDELGALRTRYAEQREHNISKRSSLLEQKSSLNQATQQPESLDAIRQRQLYSCFGFIAGLIALTTSVFASEFAIPLVLIGGVAFTIGWLNTDEHRASRLVGHKRASERASERIMALDAEASRTAEEVGLKLQHYRLRLAELGAKQTPAADPVGDAPFDASLGDARRLYAGWIEAHPSAKLLAGPRSA